MNHATTVAAEEGGFRSPDQWSEFVSGLVAELRMPLSNLVTLSDLMSRDEDSQDQNGRYTTSLRKLSEQMRELVDDASHLVRLLRETPRIEWQAVNVREVVDRLENVQRRKAWELGVSIRFIAEPGLPATIQSDPERLVSCVLQLLEAATGLAEKEIVLRVARRGGRLVIRLEPDGGCDGLERLEALVNPFEGVAARKLRERGGRTLALLLARELARTLGGELAFAQGEPSGCELRLPLDPDAVDSAPS